MKEIYKKDQVKYHKMNFRIPALIIGLLGQILIAFAFYALIPYEILGADIRTLDFVVVSIVFWLWAVYLGVAPISLADKSQKQVGSLGVRLAFVGWYSVLALLFMLYNFTGIWTTDIPTMPFKGQLLVQCILLFFLIVGIFSSVMVKNKTESVYLQEQALTNTKKNLKKVMAEIERKANGRADLSTELRNKIFTLVRETRYISPSSLPEAKATDENILSTCEELLYQLGKIEINRNETGRLLEEIEATITYRKQIM